MQVNVIVLSGISHFGIPILILHRIAVPAQLRGGAAQGPEGGGRRFNAREDSPQIRLLSVVWSDAFRVAHPVEAGLTCCIDDLKATLTESLEERIDYIFRAGASGSAGKVTNIRKVFDEPFPQRGEWQWASDHVGLMLEQGQD